MYFVCYSVWTLVAVVGVTFYVFKLIEHVIGAPVGLPDYISNHFALTQLINNPNTKRPFDDNLCLFRCLARHKGFKWDRLERPALELFQTFLQDKGLKVKHCRGVSLDDLAYSEQRYGMRIHVYSLRPHPDPSQPPFARLVRRPLTPAKSTADETDMYLNLYDHKHFSYIHNFSLYAHSYACTRCSELFSSSKGLLNHLKSCTHNTNYTRTRAKRFTPNQTDLKNSESGG